MLSQARIQVHSPGRLLSLWKPTKDNPEDTWTATQAGVARFKNFRLYRCEPDDVRTMQNPASDAAMALIRSKLASLRG